MRINRHVTSPAHKAKMAVAKIFPVFAAQLWFLVIGGAQQYPFRNTSLPYDERVQVRASRRTTCLSVCLSVRDWSVSVVVVCRISSGGCHWIRWWLRCRTEGPKITVRVRRRSAAEPPDLTLRRHGMEYFLVQYFGVRTITRYVKSIA